MGLRYSKVPVLQNMNAYTLQLLKYQSLPEPSRLESCPLPGAVMMSQGRHFSLEVWPSKDSSYQIFPKMGLWFLID